MVTQYTRTWLRAVTTIQALFAFFSGVFFSVWGDELTSPVWVFIMDVPGGGRFWGTILFIGGTLFLFGLDWNNVWGRVIGAIVTGLTYIAIGGMLCIAPFIREDTLNGSAGVWLLTGVLTLCLAAFMWQEKGPVT